MVLAAQTVIAAVFFFFRQASRLSAPKPAVIALVSVVGRAFAKRNP
jgi:hypothetical protein